MPPEDVIYPGTDGSRHLSPYSYRCLLKMEGINHQSRAVTDCNYRFTVHGLLPVGMEPNRFPSGWGGSRVLARPSSYEKSHVSLCPATGDLTSWNPSLHFVALSPGRAEDQSDKPLLVGYCHVRSRAVLTERSEFKRSKVAENALMLSAARDCGGIKPRSVPSLEADTSK